MLHKPSGGVDHAVQTNVLRLLPCGESQTIPSHLTCLQENFCMPHISESLVRGARSRAWNLTAGPQVTPKWCLALDEDATFYKPSTSLHRDRPNPGLQIPCLKSEKKVNLKAKSKVNLKAKSYAPFHKISSNFMSKVLIWWGGGGGLEMYFPLENP